MFIKRHKFTHQNDSFFGDFSRAFKRMLPLLCMAYLFSFFGYMLHMYGIKYFVPGLTEPAKAHWFALSAICILSVPVSTWMFCMGSLRYPPFAYMWFWISGGLVTLTLILGALLIPEGGYMLQSLYATIPLQIFIFIFLRFFKLRGRFVYPFCALSGLIIFAGYFF